MLCWIYPWLCFHGPGGKIEEFIFLQPVRHHLYAKRHAIGVFEEGEGYACNSCKIGIDSIKIPQKHLNRIIAFFAKTKSC